ncbi:MAG: nickel pincer cofactor biosynthesis protein LarC [Desulfomonile sp.]|nr:nickel pincer cofactor biosynthesis protein LarC [Desulfomonile sp.]
MLAYFDCFAGISGDMTLAAFIDLGLQEAYLRDQLSRLDLSGYTLRIGRSHRRGLAGVHLDVEVAHGHPHRSYREIRRIIEDSSVEDAAKATALKIFERVATAEAHVHGMDRNEVHFHEVGAVDSIIDVVGAAVGAHALGIGRVICSPLPLSRGFVQTCHGTLPTPAPATMEILKGAVVRGSDASIELVTPTGAAIACTLAAKFGPYPSFVPLKTGYGLGKSDPEEFPNALRIVLGEESESVTTDCVTELTCSVDDLDPRVLGDLMDVLFARGALDVAFTPVQMKKGRPGTLITVLAHPDLTGELSQVMLSHTTTLGVRVSQRERVVLRRKSETVRTSFGDIRVKAVHLPDGRWERRPEFEDVREIARRTGRPAREILSAIDRELGPPRSKPA